MNEPKYDPVQEVNPFVKGLVIALGFTAILVLIAWAILASL